MSSHDTSTPVKLQTKVLEGQEAMTETPSAMKREVKILRCISPSLLYVMMLYQEQELAELYRNMHTYYSKDEDHDNRDWAIGDQCCALNNELELWRRGMVVELEQDGGNAKIFYVDFAFTETVPVSNLRELTPDFKLVRNGAVKCHLSGLMSVDGKAWSNITNNYLKQLEHASEIFITKSGDIVDNSIPVQLWVYHIIPGGDLEPDIEEWCCLNNKIIEQGLADKKRQLLDDYSEFQVEEDILSSLNSVVLTVTDYLLLEPTPTVSLAARPEPQEPRVRPLLADTTI